MPGKHDPLDFPLADREYIRQRQQVPPPAEPDQPVDQPKQTRPRITTETAHTAILATSLACLAIGAGLAWGLGYAFLVTGTLLLAAIVYARIIFPRMG